MAEFQVLITDWYRRNKRDLPWRNTTDPYLIWLSEIILQQTRVDQGKSYFEKFKTNYPTVIDLANASEQNILNDWQGLGYYSRARNMKVSANQVLDQFDGVFPSTFDEIKKLKGVGPYTAAAIASFAFNEKVAVVDGNVYRVLSRIFDIEKPIDSSEGIKAFQQLANTLIPDKNPGEFNQAIMEFGALHCTPTNPSCTDCPFEFSCEARAKNIISVRPVKKSKTKVRNRFFNYAIFENENEIVVQKRENKDIWQHLFEFPLYETNERLSTDQVVTHFEHLYQLEHQKISTEFKHILSHQHLFARFIHFNEIPKSLKNLSIPKNDLENHPLPRLIDRYLENS